MDGKWIADQLDASGKSQSDLARALNLHPSQVNKMIRGRRKITATEGDAIRLFFQLSVPVPKNSLQPDRRHDALPVQNLTAALRPHEVSGAVPVYWCRAGVDGMLHFEKRPVDTVPRTEYLRFSQYAFGVEIQTDHMSPAFERRDTAIINPDRPVAPGDDVLVVQGFETAQAAPFRGVLCRLVSDTQDHWHCRQFNPAKDLRLAKAEWPLALHVAGKRSR